MANARLNPAKNVATRRYIEMRDTSRKGITAAWTGATGSVYVDGVLVGPALTVTQTGGTMFGYVELTAAQMNGDCIQIVATITNANNTEFTETIYTYNPTPTGVAPTSMSEAISNVHARWFNRHESNGLTFTVYAADGVTPLFNQLVSSGTVGVKQAF